MPDLARQNSGTVMEKGQRDSPMIRQVDRVDTKLCSLDNILHALNTFESDR